MNRVIHAGRLSQVTTICRCRWCRWCTKRSWCIHQGSEQSRFRTRKWRPLFL